MKIAFRLMIVAAVSVSIAIMLSLFPELDRPNAVDRSGDAMNGQEHPVRLTEDNLVDHLVRLPFRQNLSRVDWNGSRLTVDFRADGKVFFPGEIFDDLFLLCHFGFSQTSNVDEITVRITDQNRERRQEQEAWLLALNASKKNWRVVEADRVRLKEKDARAFLEKNFHIHYSAKWPYGESL